MSKPLTRVVEFEQRDVLLRDLEILPGLLQTRAKVDVRVVKVYSTAMANGSVFPPVVVFHTPDDRMLLSDGFHRVAARQKLGFRNVRAVVREGTMQDAILFGIEANFNPDNIREVTIDDRRHAAEIMIRNEEFRNWSDLEVARRVGVGPKVILKLRLALREKEAIPLPERVIAFTNRTPNGETRLYRPAKTDGLPYIWKSSAPFSLHEYHKMRFDGAAVNLPEDPLAAQEKAKNILRRREKLMNVLKYNNRFSGWLNQRGIYTESLPRPFGGIYAGNTVVLTVAEPTMNTMLVEVGRSVLIRSKLGQDVRVIVVGFFAGSVGHISDVIKPARQLTPPVEFMTPEELVAELGGTPVADDEGDEPIPDPEAPGDRRETQGP